MLFAPKHTVDQGWQAPDAPAPLVLQFACFSLDGRPAGDALRIDHSADGGYAPYNEYDNVPKSCKNKIDAAARAAAWNNIPLI